jgi:hypothetical protein
VAIHYALERWAALLLFSDDGRIEMDKNPAECALRAVATGRKNYLLRDLMPAVSARQQSTV